MRQAVDVFAARGYRGGSLRDVASSAGLSQAGLLHHFSSKQELLAEVLARLEQWQLGAPATAVPVGWAALRSTPAAAERTAEDVAMARLAATLLGEAVTSDHPAHGHFAARYADERARLRAAVVAAQRHEGLDPRLDPDAVALLLVSLLDGLRTQWLLDPAGVDMAAAIRSFLTLLGEPAGRAGRSDGPLSTSD